MSIHFETTLLQACRTLFGSDVRLSKEFLHRLQPKGVKAAFRNLAKTHHPDVFTRACSRVRKQQSERFCEIQQAYQLVINFLENRAPVRPGFHTAASKPAPRKRTRPVSRENKPQAAGDSPPAIPLEFGMYCFYLGKVTYQQLIDALVRQRRQRPPLGAIARQRGWLCDTKIADILNSHGHALRFGKRAVALGYLKPHQVDALLHDQRMQQSRIGQIFIDQGIMTENEANQISAGLKKHNVRIKQRIANRYKTQS